ncbi:MAG: aldehyde dehydrogenase (NAD+), partial [Nonlabens sp.]
MPSTITTPPETQITEITRLFALQQKNQFQVGNTTVRQRIAKLKNLHQVFLKYRPAIKEALYNDFRKHPSEVDLTEIYPVTSEIKHVKSSL